MRSIAKEATRQVTGEVFTKPEVVEHMLYEVARSGNWRRWSQLRILEPSCGQGAFVLPLIQRLVREVSDWREPSLGDYLTACDISCENISIVKSKTEEILLSAGCPQSIAARLVRKWFVVADFLLYDFAGSYDLVIGNPPYIRFDDIPQGKQLSYRSRYSTFSERCDIYVPFFERSLSLLSHRGVFSFICSNRFTKSSYGRQLRRLIAERYHVAVYLNMEHAQPFEEVVSAYPAIYVIDRRTSAETYSGTLADASRKSLWRARSGTHSCILSRFDSWYRGDAPWLTTDSAEKEQAELLERTYPTIEESGADTVVGIGVASGADDIFVDAQKTAEVESECLLPLVMSTDIHSGTICWHDRHILNPYDPKDDASMLDFVQYPKTGAYFLRHADRLKSRYCAKKHPDSWYRTLDRIKYEVLSKPKILVPDIQMGGNVALDETGAYYPHHNVYWITSESWNLKALCVLLRSKFVTDQIRRVSVQMRGGNIRYQAQNLRKVRIPSWSSLNECDVELLASLYETGGDGEINRAVDRVLSHAASRQGSKPRRVGLVRTPSIPRTEQMLLAVV